MTPRCTYCHAFVRSGSTVCASGTGCPGENGYGLVPEPHVWTPPPAPPWPLRALDWAVDFKDEHENVLFALACLLLVIEMIVFLQLS